MRIRECKTEDVAKLAELYAGFYNELRSRQGLKTYSKEKYIQEIEQHISKDKFFIAEMLNNEVGFIRISQRDGIFWFEELYVKPEYRLKGVGRSLVRKAEEYVKTHDDYAYLMVLPQDRRAINFWLRMGYTILNTIELAKNLKDTEENTRYVPFLGNIFQIYKWKIENYTSLEAEFLELVEQSIKAGTKGETILKIFTDALKNYLKSEDK